jgi:hypothetical protein
MIQSVVLEAWRCGETDGLVTRLTEEATFSSPVADYRGRAKAAHVLGLIATVLDSVDQTTGWGGEGDAVFAFVARVGGSELQGLIREDYDPAGGLDHVTLFLRPYRVLRDAMATMAQRLHDSPLPGPVD